MPEGRPPRPTSGAAACAGLRLLLVLGASTGGIGAHVASLARELAARGLVVSVAGPPATDRLFGFAAAGAEFVPVPIPRKVDLAGAVLALRSLRLAARRAEVVHAHGLRAGVRALAATRYPRRPLVVSWHNAVLATGARRVGLGAAERAVARGADVTLGASADLVARARTLGAAEALPGPVAAGPDRAPSRARTAVRTELGVGPGRPLILAVGRLAPQKDHPVLLDAAASWAGRDPAPLVVVAGDGPQRAALQQRITAEDLPVRLLGHRADVADLLAAADLMVLTSRWEARALVAQEALRAGVPLVATAVGGIGELVGPAAELVPAGDAAELARRVAALLDDPPRCAALRSAGPRQARRWPDETAVAEQALGVYRRLAAGGVG